MASMFPIEQVRERFPALCRKDDGRQVIYFDGPGGTQMVDFAFESMYRYIRNGMANLHGTFNTSADTDALLDEAREAVADLLGCQSNEVAFGANMTTHAFAIARSLAGLINEGDEIVVTELDHRANVDPWITLFYCRGRWFMFGINNFEVFLVTAILLNLTPGTDTMYIVSRSISQGRAAGIYSAFGITSGIVVHTLLAAFGLSVILTQSAFLFQTVKIAGAIYLAYLGIQMLIAKTNTNEQKSLPFQSNKKIFFQGLITNVTNPKVALFFLAFLPQFIQVDAGTASPIPFIILGMTFTLTGGIWCLLTAYFSSMATTSLRKNAKAGTVLNRLTGIVFIGMGIQLLNTKVTSY